MRMRSLLLTGGVVLGLVGASALQTTTDAPAAAATTVTRLTPSLVDNLQRIGETRFADVFGSVRVTSHESHAIVYLSSPDARAESVLAGLAAPGVVSFARTPHARADVLAVHAKVTARAGGLARAGVRIVSWFPGINGDGMEHIGVLALSRAKARTLQRLFGARNIVVENVPADQAPVTTARRNNDSAPWNGGDNLTSHGIGCTSAVGIHISGEGNRTLTAAHCYEPGWSIWNAFAGETGDFMGTEESRDVSYGGDDTAILDVPPSDIVWTGKIGSPVRVYVTGYATNPDGYTVCNEGAYSGEVCSVVQNNDYGCISVGPYTGLSGSRVECNIVKATSSGIANQEGDSGGPMIRYVSGALKVTGVVSAAGGNQVPCEYNATTCYPTVFYTAMNEIVNTEYPGSYLVTN